MDCKRTGCDNQVVGKALFCSSKCKQAHHRNRNTSTVTDSPPTVTNPTVTEGECDAVTIHDLCKNQPVLQPLIDMRPEPVAKCYNRPAVQCYEFNTRPQPLDPADTPIKHNRGRYKRKDGTVYQFDSRGRAFDPYTGRDGKQHMAVYADPDEVRRVAIC